MIMLSSKTKEALKEKAQDSFTIEEVADVMAHAVAECIRDVTERSRGDEKARGVAKQ